MQLFIQQQLKHSYHLFHEYILKNKATQRRGLNKDWLHERASSSCTLLSQWLLSCGLEADNYQREDSKGNGVQRHRLHWFFNSTLTWKNNGKIIKACSASWSFPYRTSFVAPFDTTATAQRTKNAITSRHFPSSRVLSFCCQLFWIPPSVWRQLHAPWSVARGWPGLSWPPTYTTWLYMNHRQRSTDFLFHDNKRKRSRSRSENCWQWHTRFIILFELNNLLMDKLGDGRIWHSLHSTMVSTGFVAQYTNIEDKEKRVRFPFLMHWSAYIFGSYS